MAAISGCSTGVQVSLSQLPRDWQQVHELMRLSSRRLGTRPWILGDSTSSHPLAEGPWAGSQEAYLATPCPGFQAFPTGPDLEEITHEDKAWLTIGPIKQQLFFLLLGNTAGPRTPHQVAPMTRISGRTRHQEDGHESLLTQLLRL